MHFKLFVNNLKILIIQYIYDSLGIAFYISGRHLIILQKLSVIVYSSWNFIKNLFCLLSSASRGSDPQGYVKVANHVLRTPFTR